MATLKQQLMSIMNQLPSRKHAEVFIDAMVNAKHVLTKENIIDPTLEEVMDQVMAEIDAWISSIEYDYADPTGNHKKGSHEDAIFETRNIFNNLGYNY
jgi:hypothetical protein